MSGPRWVRANLAWRQTVGGVVLPPTGTGDASGGFVDLDLHAALTHGPRVFGLEADITSLGAYSHHVVDASACGRVRIIVDVTEPLPAGAYASAQYVAADNTDPAEPDWQFVGEGESGPYVAVDAVTAVPLRSAWVNLALGAMTDITIRGVVVGGDGVTVLGLRKLQVQMDGKPATVDDVPSPTPIPTITEPCNRGGFRADALPGAGGGGTAPPPYTPPVTPPSGGGTAGTGAVYFRADAEAGTLVPWSTSYLPFGTGGIAAASSTTRFKKGARSWKFMVPAAGAGNNAHYSQLWGGSPQSDMGGPSGNFFSGFYSFWLYLDSGWNSVDPTNFNTLLGFMTATSAPRPMFDIGIRLPPSGPANLQWHVHLSSATQADAGFENTAPTIPGYTMASNGFYFMSASSPAGIVTFPRSQWVLNCLEVRMNPANGIIRLWQDNVLLMDLTAPTLNTLRGQQGSNSAGDARLQFGIYGGPDSGDQILYADDFLVTDGRVTG